MAIVKKKSIQPVAIPIEEEEEILEDETLEEDEEEFVLEEGAEEAIEELLSKKREREALTVSGMVSTEVYPTDNHLKCKVKANTDPTITEYAPPFNETLILRDKVK